MGAMIDGGCTIGAMKAHWEVPPVEEGLEWVRPSSWMLS